MKRYYINNGNLYSSEVPIQGEGFDEISAEEYERRMDEASEKKEAGIPVDNADNCESEDLATDSDYISALESLGVDFGG